jgi:UDP-N-acetylmuramate--alanine ligase
MPSAIHISGIGGVGMSALAQALVDRGESVTGSDRLLDHGDLTPTLARLERQGVRLSRQDGSGVTPGTARLVVSSAIENDNPEVVKARALGVPEVHRAAELARTLSGHRLIAVAGTCGKSTVTAMLGHILAGAGLDPFVVNGAEIIGWDKGGTRIGSVREGKGEWAVAEVDESDKSLMAFSPEDAIITNASADHFGMDETQEVFEAFRRRVSGTVIDGRSEHLEPQEVALAGWSGSFTLGGLRYTVPMPGRHNVLNAWHAVRMALAVGADPSALASALAGFPGVARRLQRVGRCGNALVIDDYAHNPEKLAAAWGTLAAAFPQGVAAVWRPHGFGPLRKMKDALAETFSRVCRPQDSLGLLPVYDAGGTADRGYTSGDFAAMLSGRDVPVTLLGSLDDAEAFLRARRGECGALVTFGARDPGLPRLAASLAGK